jgi:hypothetical protein
VRALTALIAGRPRDQHGHDWADSQ